EDAVVERQPLPAVIRPRKVRRHHLRWPVNAFGLGAGGGIRAVGSAVYAEAVARARAHVRHVGGEVAGAVRGHRDTSLTRCDAVQFHRCGGGRPHAKCAASIGTRAGAQELRLHPPAHSASGAWRKRRTPSGGSVMLIECMRPWYGTGVLCTPP